ncbi:MAG TPA: allantoate amidohydrolase [Opitutaceae bacterium]|nr:allantoate amidohydrolase [Opitutaceae bacterium]
MSRAAAKKLGRWLDELGRVSDEPGKLTRTFLSPAMRRANALVEKWMRDAGLAVREDAFGNLIGRAEAASRNRDESRRPRPAKTLLLGSHLDTVRDAGRFDGALGVLLPIAALAELRRRGVALPFAVEVLGFSEEEGVRFSSAYLGSKGYTGQLRATDLKLRDQDGATVREAIARWSGGISATAQRRNAARTPRPQQLLGYLEVHIEQGPVLEDEKLALGVVSAIAGQTRGRLIFRGQAGHAGTTPMPLRRDALAGAAEFILSAELFARKNAPLVATVGTIAASPGAANVIPGAVTLSLDVRHPRDVSRRAALRALVADAKKIARRRGLTCDWETKQDNGAVACAPELTALLARSVRAVQGRSLTLVSGAGHDAVVVSALAPVAMLFVRCRGGLSHHPDESVAPADLERALNAVLDFLARLAQQEKRA